MSRASLWPSDLVAPPTRPPLTILREQANLLGQQTQQIVEGEVRTTALGAQSDPVFRHEFILRAPALDDYRYTLFDVEHGIEFYPLTVMHPLRNNTGTRQCNSEEEFVDALRGVFGHPETIRVVNALLAQSRS